jgi:hypothetical protein
MGYLHFPGTSNLTWMVFSTSTHSSLIWIPKMCSKQWLQHTFSGWRPILSAEENQLCSPRAVGCGGRRRWSGSQWQSGANGLWLRWGNGDGLTMGQGLVLGKITMEYDLVQNLGKLVGGLEHDFYDFPYILRMSSSQLTFIFFRCVGIPLTRKVSCMISRGTRNPLETVR